LLEEGIRDSRSVAVLVGASGLGPWEDEEVRAALTLAVKKKRPVIPVLLPDAPAAPDLPMLLQERTWVDMRSEVDPGNLSAVNMLIWGITGSHPDRMDPTPSPGVIDRGQPERHGRRDDRAHPTQASRPWPEMDDSIQEALRKVLTGIPQLRLPKDREHLVNRALGAHPVVDRITSWEETQANFADKLVRLMADGGHQPLADGRHGVAGVLYVIAQWGYADHPRIRDDYAALTEIFGDQGPPSLWSSPRLDSPVERARAKWSKYPTE